MQRSWVIAGSARALVAVVEMLLPQQQSMTSGRGAFCTEVNNFRSHFSLKDN